MKISEQIFSALKAAGTPEKAKTLSRFFKTSPGEYAEFDKFLGVTVPETRKIAKEFSPQTHFRDLEILLKNPWHEARLCSLLILVLKFENAEKNSRERRQIFDFYTKNARFCNSWDLVDLSAPKIFGEFLADVPAENSAREREILWHFSESENLWETRISIVSTLAFVRRNDFSATIELAEKLKNHEHDLIRKAVGWLLREVGKRNRNLLKSFLEAHSGTMARISLRYALEHFSSRERQSFHFP